MVLLGESSDRFLLFYDDLSFDAEDTNYKSLKAVLEGGIEGRPENVIFYATSNRRHLLPRETIENEHSTAINPSEAAEEKVAPTFFHRRRRAASKLRKKSAPSAARFFCCFGVAYSPAAIPMPW
jgi:Protein of unknown function (DUF815)